MSNLTDFRLVYQEVKDQISLEAPPEIRAERDLATHHGRHYCTDAVSVEIRLWSRYAGEYGTSAVDVVLHSRVYVDGGLLIDTCKLLDPKLTDAQLQRIGIAEFDRLLADHPWLGQVTE